MCEESTTSCRLKILAQHGQPCPMAGIREKIIHIPEASALTLTHLSYPGNQAEWRSLG